MNFPFELKPPVKIKGAALFSRGRKIRREIRRWWAEEPVRWVVWLMLNPSIAAETRMDPTARRVTHFTRLWGYGGWIGVNLYPLVTSNPKEMWRWAAWDKNGPDWSARDDCMVNLSDIDDVARIASLRLVAFGAEPVRRDEGWLEQCLEAFMQPANDPGADARLFCLGTSASGQPLHPLARGRLRVPDGKPILWRES